MSDNDSIDISSNKEEKKLQLGITTVSDLLINKKITNIYSESDNNDNEFSINNDEVVLSIPDYQRPYKWTVKNVNQLFEDIEDAYFHNKEVYRVGTLILHHDPKESKHYNVVDGQQRLISLSVILSCLQAVIKEKNASDKNEENVNELNIKFTNKSQMDNEFTKYNLKANYCALKKRFNRYQIDLLKKIKDYIFNYCQFIVVITQDLSEAFQFFDSQNNRGKELYPHDLLKAFHLREMNNIDDETAEKIAKEWEELDQKKLAELFNEYLYRLKEWLRGKESSSLNKDNLYLFKGISSKDNYPYAQYNKAAHAYLSNIKKTVSYLGLGIVSPFQLTEPIIAGKTFFEYTLHYYGILNDIRNNDKYEGYYLNGNAIVKTLDRYFNSGSGNLIVRKMFDIALLLYVDRFCPNNPSTSDFELFDEFLIYAFIWAYSMRLQYGAIRASWAENYISGNNKNNSFNIYRIISETSSPKVLLSRLADELKPIEIVETAKNGIAEQDKDKIYKDIQHFFEEYGFLQIKQEQKNE